MTVLHFNKRKKKQDNNLHLLGSLVCVSETLKHYDRNCHILTLSQSLPPSCYKIIMDSFKGQSKALNLTRVFKNFYTLLISFQRISELRDSIS